MLTFQLWRVIRAAIGLVLALIIVILVGALIRTYNPQLHEMLIWPRTRYEVPYTPPKPRPEEKRETYVCQTQTTAYWTCK